MPSIELAPRSPTPQRAFHDLPGQRFSYPYDVGVIRECSALRYVYTVYNAGHSQVTFTILGQGLTHTP